MVLKFPGVEGMGWVGGGGALKGSLGGVCCQKAFKPSSYLNKNHSVHFPV